jgi:hypothetical protein
MTDENKPQPAEAPPEPVPESEPKARRHAIPQGPPPPPKPTKVSKEDRLEVENLQLKLQNVQLQLQIMQADLAKALHTRDEYVKKFKEMREYFHKKYGVDLISITIDEDGNISQLPPNAKLPNIPGF